MKKLTTEEFVAKARLVHGDKYGYELVDYKDTHKNVKIICKTHNVFEQFPSNHLREQGCPDCGVVKCSKAITQTTEDCIKIFKEIHGDNYLYYLVDYKGNNINVIIICKIHGPFQQTPKNHKKGEGCMICGGKQKLNTEIFINRAMLIHGDTYLYYLTNYTDIFSKVIIICKIHGKFLQTPHSHLNSKSGCPDCKYKNQQIVGGFLAENNLAENRRFIIKLSTRYVYCDFYIPSQNIIVEYNGLQHYGPVRFNGISYDQAEKNFVLQQKRDELLKKYCKENNIKLLEIDGRIYKGDKLKEYLQNYFKLAA